MGDAVSTVQGRALGEELRKRREARGMSGTDMARFLGWDQSKVSRLESGKYRFRETDVVAYLAACRVTGADRRRLLDMVPGANQPDLLQRNRGELRENLKILIRHEWEASRIVNYEPALIPGLLQIPEYTRELIKGRGQTPEERVELLVQIKQERQRVLRGEYPTAAVFLVHEYALRRNINNSAAMRDQLLHLVFLSSRPHITIQVVPESAGLAVPAAPFMLMDFSEHRPVAYLEHAAASVFLEQKAETEFYRRQWQRLAQLALSEAESRVFMADLAGPIAPGRTPDDLPIFYPVEEE